LGYTIEGDKKKVATVELKFYENKPVITEIRRISKPGLRIYKSSEELVDHSRGLDTFIVSTSKGVMSASHAKKMNLGGEVLVKVK
jgi:small subunit ribosomal protein S8